MRREVEMGEVIVWCTPEPGMQVTRPQAAAFWEPGGDFELPRGR
jgi:hypothetical protein